MTEQEQIKLVNEAHEFSQKMRRIHEATELLIGLAVDFDIIMVLERLRRDDPATQDMNDGYIMREAKDFLEKISTVFRIIEDYSAPKPYTFEHEGKIWIEKPKTFEEKKELKFHMHACQKNTTNKDKVKK